MISWSRYPKNSFIEKLTGKLSSSLKTKTNSVFSVHDTYDIKFLFRFDLVLGSWTNLRKGQHGSENGANLLHNCDL